VAQGIPVAHINHEDEGVDDVVMADSIADAAVMLNKKSFCSRVDLCFSHD
jgi:hypothetical protein